MSKFQSLIYTGLLLSLLIVSIVPSVVSAQFEVPCYDAGAPCIDDFGILVEVILRVVWVVFTVIAVVCFVLAGVLFLNAQGDPAKVKIARSAVIWGSVGVVVGILAYSIILIIGSAL